MIDIKKIRLTPEKFKKACKDKGFEVDIDRLLDIDAELVEAKKQLQDISTEKNRLGKLIPTSFPEQRQFLVEQLKNLKQRGKDQASRTALALLQVEFDNLMLQVAQPTDMGVPVGKDSKENVEMRHDGGIRLVDYDRMDHVKLGLHLDIIDIYRGGLLAGPRTYFLKGDGALLHWAVLRFAMDHMVKIGYVPFSVPLLVSNRAMMGTGFFPGSEDQTYQMEKDQLNLAGTAEVPLTAYHMGEILKAEELPKKYVAMSSCFRREAGAAGKATHGLYRVHQFDKVEQVVICKNDIKESNRFHEEILANSEAVMKALELPYRIVNVCTGDLGRGQAKKYDIEAYMPSRYYYYETHSASKFYDFQARRLGIRYKDTKIKKNVFCHTLNNTVIASPRILIPILELYQNPDMSITIPEVLRPYMGGREKIIKN